MVWLTTGGRIRGLLGGMAISIGSKPVLSDEGSAAYLAVPGEPVSCPFALDGLRFLSLL